MHFSRKRLREGLQTFASPGANDSIRPRKYVLLLTQFAIFCRPASHAYGEFGDIICPS